MTTAHTAIAGRLVTLTISGLPDHNLDGFHVTGRRKNRCLLIFVHGMGSNFYKSRFKKAWMRLGPRHGVDLFSFNNRGYEADVADENFTHCLADIDAALAFACAEGYRDIVLLGHSTGCQKIAYYQDVRKPENVRGLVFTAIGDDLAIARRDLGKSYERWLNTARRWVLEGKGGKRLPPRCMGFTARRFISAADPHSREANIFRFEGRLTLFRRLRIPMLSVFPEEEQYACIPVRQAAAILEKATRSKSYHTLFVSSADHSFRGREDACVKACLPWIKRLCSSRSRH